MTINPARLVHGIDFEALLQLGVPALIQQRVVKRRRGIYDCDGEREDCDDAR